MGRSTQTELIITGNRSRETLRPILVSEKPKKRQITVLGMISRRLGSGNNRRGQGNRGRHGKFTQGETNVLICLLK